MLLVKPREGYMLYQESLTRLCASLLGAFEGSTRRDQKLAENIMTMLYLFLSIFALQLFFATPLVIGKEQAENREEPPSSELNKTLSESTDPKTPPFVIMKDQEAPGKASTFQHFQAKCKLNNFIILTIFFL